MEASRTFIHVLTTDKHVADIDLGTSESRVGLLSWQRIL
jgi:hypothetical protein